MRTTRLSLLMLGTLGLLGCGDDSSAAGPSDSGSPTPDGAAPQAPVYYGDIETMVRERCVFCHREGGIAPFRLDDYNQLSTFASAALVAIEAGDMPPWPADPSCRTFEGELTMPEAEIERFRAWVSAERPEGDPEDALEPYEPPVIDFEPTDEARMPEPYVADPSHPDDYRCFILDTELDTDRYLTGSRVLPDQDALVHHVLVYAIEPDQVPTVERLDAEDDGPGYTCFGGPVPSSAEDAMTGSGGLPTQIGAWVPGQAPDVAREGRAIRIAAGSKLVMQIHYNLLETEPAPDQTALELILEDEPPEYLTTTRPAPILDLDIPAGDPNAVHTRTFTNYGSEPVVITQLTGHMHLLGTSIHAELQRDGGANECMFSIPEWDFDWQRSYRLPPGEEIRLETGDAFELTCTYDNSPGNQPVVNGERQEPRDVSWGEGTLDEMCLLYMRTEQPFEAETASEAQCSTTQACVESCTGESPADCLFDCEDPTVSCLTCAFDGLTACASSECAAPFIVARSCLVDCATNVFVLGGNMRTCFERQCADEYEDLRSCLDPVLESGACDEPLSGCGLTLPSP